MWRPLSYMASAITCCPRWIITRRTLHTTSHHLSGVSEARIVEGIAFPKASLDSSRDPLQLAPPLSPTKVFQHPPRLLPPAFWLLPPSYQPRFPGARSARVGCISSLASPARFFLYVAALPLARNWRRRVAPSPRGSPRSAPDLLPEVAARSVLSGLFGRPRRYTPSEMYWMMCPNDK